MHCHHWGSAGSPRTPQSGVGGSRQLLLAGWWGGEGHSLGPASSPASAPASPAATCCGFREVLEGFVAPDGRLALGETLPGILLFSRGSARGRHRCLGSLSPDK